MSRSAQVALAIAIALLVGWTSTAQAAPPTPCDPEILLPGGQCPADVSTAVAQCCPCDAPSFINHGGYVHCVAHAANALRKAGCLDDSARRSIKKCAARSTCGKPGFVTCCQPQPGVCGPSGECARTDPPVSCTTDEDCPPQVRCTTKRSEELCLAAGGTPGAPGSCCGACAAP